MAKNLNLSELTENKKGLSTNNLFFFYDNVENLEITPNSVAHAYLAILDEDLNSAKVIFDKNDSPRAKWGSILTDIVKDRVLNVYPTFFQIRNFFEIDTDFLLRNQKIDYVENLLGALEIFSDINQEVYKFAGRVMYENRLYSAAMKYMEQSKKIYYNDPELHFMYAKYYMKMNNLQEAYFYVNECLRLLPSYYPALSVKRQIEEYNF